MEHACGRFGENRGVILVNVGLFCLCVAGITINRFFGYSVSSFVLLCGIMSRAICKLLRELRLRLQNEKSASVQQRL